MLQNMMLIGVLAAAGFASDSTYMAVQRSGRSGHRFTSPVTSVVIAPGRAPASSPGSEDWWQPRVPMILVMHKELRTAPVNGLAGRVFPDCYQR